MKSTGMGIALVACVLCFLACGAGSARAIDLDLTQSAVTNVTKDSITIDNIAVEGLSDKVIVVFSWDGSRLSLVPTQAWVRPALDGVYQAVGFSQIFSNGHTVTEANYSDYWGILTLRGNRYTLQGRMIGEDVDDSGTLDVMFTAKDTALYHQVGARGTFDGLLTLEGDSLYVYTPSRRTSAGLEFELWEAYLKVAP